MKTRDGKFIGGNFPGTLAEEAEQAGAILQRIFDHARTVMEQRKPLDLTELKLTPGEFLIVQRRYNLPDHPKRIIGVPIVVRAAKKVIA